MVDFPHLYPAGKATFKDSEVTKANELIVPWNGKTVKSFGILGVPLSKPSISHSGAASAPGLGNEKLVRAIDIVEIDPTIDFRNMTSRIAAHVVLQFLKGEN